MSMDIFSGPCFGDTTPSDSSVATMLDAPSPSPMQLAPIELHYYNPSINESTHSAPMICNAEHNQLLTKTSIERSVSLVLLGNADQETDTLTTENKDAMTSDTTQTASMEVTRASQDVNQLSKLQDDISDSARSYSQNPLLQDNPWNDSYMTSSPTSTIPAHRDERNEDCVQMDSSPSFLCDISSAVIPVHSSGLLCDATSPLLSNPGFPSSPNFVSDARIGNTEPTVTKHAPSNVPPIFGTPSSFFFNWDSETENTRKETVPTDADMDILARRQLSSSPPSSSPVPALFTSSPLASSQSSQVTSQVTDESSQDQTKETKSAESCKETMPLGSDTDMLLLHQRSSLPPSSSPNPALSTSSPLASSQSSQAIDDLVMDHPKISEQAESRDLTSTDADKVETGRIYDYPAPEDLDPFPTVPTKPGGFLFVFPDPDDDTRDPPNEKHKSIGTLPQAEEDSSVPPCSGIYLPDASSASPQPSLQVPEESYPGHEEDAGYLDVKSFSELVQPHCVDESHSPPSSSPGVLSSPPLEPSQILVTADPIPEGAEEPVFTASTLEPDIIHQDNLSPSSSPGMLSSLPPSSSQTSASSKSGMDIVQDLALESLDLRPTADELDMLDLSPSPPENTTSILSSSPSLISSQLSVDAQDPGDPQNSLTTEPSLYNLLDESSLPPSSSPGLSSPPPFASSQTSFTNESSVQCSQEPNFPDTVTFPMPDFEEATNMKHVMEPIDVPPCPLSQEIQEKSPVFQNSLDDDDVKDSVSLPTSPLLLDSHAIFESSSPPSAENVDECTSYDTTNMHIFVHSHGAFPPSGSLGGMEARPLAAASAPPEESAHKSPPGNKRKREEPQPRVEEHASKEHLHSVPVPKRSTIASQKRQHKILTTPFRSPLMKKAETASLDGKLSNDVSTLPQSPIEAAAMPSSPVEPGTSEMKGFSLRAKPVADVKKRHRTQRAAAQFKSPLANAAISGSGAPVRLTPTIQTLERRLQILKRASKIKNDGDEEILEGLAKKWTDAGREVAWEVWELVKENAGSDGDWGKSTNSKRNAAGGKRGFEESWGWEEKGDSKKLRGDKEDSSWGWDTTSQKREEDDDHMAEESQEPAGEEEEEESRPENTLGMMLRQLGIAPETLGWNEEEGCFVGE